MSYYRRNTFGLSNSELSYLLITSTTLSGILSYSGVTLAAPVFIFLMLLWSCVAVAVIFGGGVILLLAPLHIFNALINYSQETPPINPRTLRKSRTPRKSRAFSDRCGTGFRELRDNNYDAIKLDSVSVAPLDETDIHAFRNTPAYKKMQAANKNNTIKQYASY